ncbi:MAG: EamA family transporter [Clostridia bacterium]|nr:EamA family transporter [Clostridia bacterium]
MHKKQMSALLGYGGVLLSAVIFGFTPVLAALSYQGGNNGVNMAFLRALLPLPVLYLLARRCGDAPSFSQRKTGAVLGALLFGCTLLLYSSYAYLSVGLATTLHFMYPLYVALFEKLVQHRHLGRARVAGLVIAMAGMVLLLDMSDGGMNPIGLLLAGLSGVCYGGYIIVLGREAKDPMPLYRLMFEVSRAGAVLCAAVGLAMGRLTLALSGAAWGYAVCVAMLAAIVGCVLFQAGVRIVGKSNAAIFSLLEPVTSIIFSILLMGDSLSLIKLMGCALIIGGLGVTTLHKRA